MSQPARASGVVLHGSNPATESLYEQGFRFPFQQYQPPCLLERWDHPDGRYKLVAYNGDRISIMEAVNNQVWRKMLSIGFRGETPPIVFTSEDWFRLRVNNPTGNIGDFSQLLSPEQAPKARDDWYRFTDNYVPPMPVPVFKRTRMILENGRTGKLMFIRTYRAARGKWIDFLDNTAQLYRAMRVR